MTKKTHGLTILMLKPDVTTPDDAVKDPQGHASLEVTIGAETGKLYYKQNPSQIPKWVKIFDPTATQSTQVKH